MTRRTFLASLATLTFAGTAQAWLVRPRCSFCRNYLPEGLWLPVETGPALNKLKPDGRVICISCMAGGLIISENFKFQVRNAGALACWAIVE